MQPVIVEVMMSVFLKEDIFLKLELELRVTEEAVIRKTRGWGHEARA